MIALIRSGAMLGALEHALARLAARFAEAGYAPVSPGHLFPAETLLDLYGEDLRGRAFLFPGSGSGEELCLRPDFTVPVVLAHAAEGWEARAAHSYQGPVFRRQPPGSARPTEYLQAGIENFGEGDRATTEAGVLATIIGALEEIGVGPVEIATGDLGIAFALIDALEMPERRRAALKRHFWRPSRFHALVEGFVAGPSAPSARRAALIAAASRPEAALAVAAMAAEAGEVVGLRETAEIAARAVELASAAAEPPMPREQAELIEAVLAVSGPAPEALEALRQLAGAALAPALDRFEARLEALQAAGIDTARLPFDADFGRKLEYYDGFVFEITAADRDDLPPLAGGGRYDAMTLRLGASAPVPAVGAMLRPEAALAAAAGVA